jgi:hypothetical protein
MTLNAPEGQLVVGFTVQPLSSKAPVQPAEGQPPRLSMCFSHIANYNVHRFYEEWFFTLGDQLAFSSTRRSFVATAVPNPHSRISRNRFTPKSSAASTWRSNLCRNWSVRTAGSFPLEHPLLTGVSPPKPEPSLHLAASISKEPHIQRRTALPVSSSRRRSARKDPVKYCGKGAVVLARCCRRL